MASKVKSKRPSLTVRRVQSAIQKAKSLGLDEIPSIEQEIGRSPKRKRTEAQRLGDKIELESRIIWNRLQKAGGKMPFNDHSSATEIKAEFNLSKKAFKRGLGKLYRLGRVKLLPRGIQAIPLPAGKERKEYTDAKGTRLRPKNDPPNRTGRS